MKHLLQQLSSNQPLSRDQAIEAFGQIMSGEATPAQTGALLAMIEQRGPSVDELVGAATVMRQKVKRVENPDGLTIIDTCGVGGTASTLFNISTTAAIVAAAVGRPHGVAVAKHGNRSITSKSGSSQVLEMLGVNVEVSPDTLTHCLSEIGICFCFAPCHHPAMKHAAPVRQELGIRTIFNLLGPLTNPAGARRQLIGVPTAAMTQLFADVLRELDAEHAMVVHSTLPDGRPLGELTSFGPTHAHELHRDAIRSMTIDPADHGIEAASLEDVTVSGPEESALKVRQVLSDDPQAKAARDIVRLNAAAALIVADLARDMAQGLEMATEALDDGRAARVLDELARLTQADQPTPA